MIATPALLSPAPSTALLAIAGGIGNPAVSVDGSGTASAGSGSNNAVSFSALLASSKAPVSATIVPPLAVSSNIVTATRRSSELAANPVAAGSAAQFVTPSIAQFFTVTAQSTPDAAPAATGSTPPLTGKVLPPAGIANQIALAIPFATASISGSGPAADVTLADDSAPVDPAATDAPAPAIALIAIPTSLISPQPPLLPAGSPRPTATATTSAAIVIPRMSARTIGSGRATAPEPAEVPAPGDLGQMPQPAQREHALLGEPAPIGAAETVRAAVAAPLTRLAADALQLPVAATMQVALPMSAALAKGSGERPAALVQPIPRGRATVAAAAAPDSEPADRLNFAPHELAQAAPAFAPTPLVASFVPTVAPAPGDPSEAMAPAPASPTERVDFATLVDTIARAREQAAPRDMATPVSVSLAHADFGPVALRFRHDGDTLAVTMASADPGFARAVSAASVADASAAAGQRQQADAQPRPHQPGNNQPQSSVSLAASTSHGSAQANSGQAGQGQTGQSQADQRQPGQNRPLPRAASRTANRGGPDPDIFA